MRIDKLDSTNLEYKAEQLEEYEFLYKGEIEGKEIQEFYKKWLPKKYKEKDDVYQERIDVALYENEAGTMIDFIAAMLFSMPAVIEMDKQEPFYQQFFDNMDGAKTDINAYFRDVFIKSLIFRNAYSWADLPKKVVEANSLGEQESLGQLNPALITIGREAHYWQDKGKKLTQLLFSAYDYRRPTIEDDPKVFKVWTYIDSQVIRKYEVDRDLATVEADQVGGDILHGHGEIPVARLQLPYGLWAMRKMRDPAVGLFRAQNRHDFSLDRTAYATPFTKTKYGDAQFTPREAYGFSMFEGEEAGFIESKGTHFQYTEDIISKKRDSFYRIMHNLALSANSDDSKVKMSGESKKQDWEAALIVLSAYAKLMRDHIKETLDLIALIRGDKIQFTVKGLEDWNQETLESLLNTMSMTGALQSETFHKTLHKKIAAKVFPDEDKKITKKIADEIDKGDYSTAILVPPAVNGDDPDDLQKIRGSHGSD